MVSVVLTVLAIGVVMFLVNRYGGEWIDGKFLKIANAVVVICIIFWLMSVFGLLDSCRNIPVPRVGQ
jgi:hypothetical protein